MAVVVAESLLACSGIDADDVGLLTRQVLETGLPAAMAAHQVVRQRMGNSTAGNDSGAQAVWALRHGSSFADVVTTAIDLGGDTDSVATIAEPAVVGATFGVRAIPSRWATCLHGRVTRPDGSVCAYDRRRFEELAMALVDWPAVARAAVFHPCSVISV